MSATKTTNGSTRTTNGETAGPEQFLKFWGDFYTQGLKNALEAQELSAKLVRELVTQSVHIMAGSVKAGREYLEVTNEALETVTKATSENVKRTLEVLEECSTPVRKQFDELVRTVSKQ